jgi:uncharacterized protein YkwD
MKYPHVGCIVAVPLALGALVLAAAGDEEGRIKLNRDEAKKAVEYLNRVRQKPASFSDDVGVDLNGVRPRPALRWNPILARVAERKAIDMARRNYFSHTTPEGLGINRMIHAAGYRLPSYMLKKKSANFFESIAAGSTTGQEIIKLLIVDEGVASLGHRKHLLGMTAHNAVCRDVGIGIASNPRSEYKTYASIIIARRK